MSAILPTVEPESPAGRILNLLARRGPMTIGELVQALGVTTTAVRQQVNRLVGERRLRVAKRRAGTGRPADVFSLTQEARKLYGQRSGEFLRMLIAEISETAGAATIRSILDGVRGRMTAVLRQQVGNGPVRQRFHRLAEWMSGEGLVADSNAPGNGPVLTVFTCPYPELTARFPEVCEMDRKTVSELVGQPVELDQHVRDGHRCCQFSVTA